MKSIRISGNGAEMGGSEAEVNPRTPIVLLPLARNSSTFWGIRTSIEARQRHAS